MYLEVSVESKETAVYRLARPELLLGSVPTCDIHVAEKSISRKHIKIVEDDGRWFAVDQGSTNGSYLDEEQLVPGKRAEIVPGMQLRLGDNVFLSLLDHAENALEPQPKMLKASALKEVPESPIQEEDKTRVVSLADLKAAAAESAKKRKQEAEEKRAARAAAAARRKKEEKRSFNRVLAISLAVLVVGFLGNRAWKSSLRKVKKETIVKKLQGAGEIYVEAELDGLRAPKGQLLSRSKIGEMIVSPKCLKDEERALCALSSDFMADKNGVIYKDSAYFILVNEQQWEENALASIAVAQKASRRTLSRVAFLRFLKEHFVGLESVTSNQQIYYIAFYRQDGPEERYALGDIGAFKGIALPMILKGFDEDAFKDPGADLEELLSSSAPYYILY